MAFLCDCLGEIDLVLSALHRSATALCAALFRYIGTVRGFESFQAGNLESLVP